MQKRLPLTKMAAAAHHDEQSASHKDGGAPARAAVAASHKDGGCGLDRSQESVTSPHDDLAPDLDRGKEENIGTRETQLSQVCRC
ncbi:hypothetical protein scyTo_0019469 [Scyliorhinus torazame]|uniref:Uncharacterized protein n=1 Tax=Scyliorhinus torazame TaxID=75743 RepID=A0A401Q0I0_SCYTO|nr:hypothetical protein [Scyliorhinus torazame]